MAIAKMNKVYLIAHQAEKEKILSLLQQIGVMEISDLQAKDGDSEEWAQLVESDQENLALQEIESELGDLRFCLDFLKRYFPSKKNLMDSLGSSKKVIASRDLPEERHKWRLIFQQVFKELRRAEETLMNLRNEETRLQNLKSQLSPWLKLELPLEQVENTSLVHMQLGVLPESEINLCREELARQVPEAVFQEVNIERGEGYIFLIYPADNGETANLLKDRGFNKQEFIGFTGTPRENLALIDRDLAAAVAVRDKVLEDTRQQTEHREALQCYLDYLEMERGKKEAVANFARTDNSFIVKGWLREKDLPCLREALSQQCETVYLTARPPDEGEMFPVALENKPTVAPFEFITKLYGTPHPYGIDPTFALTPFFIMFFGLCMTDAGYGVILALLAGLGLWKLKMGGAGRSLLWILFAGGLSTIIFGLLLGGWFGGLIPLAPLFFDTLQDPMRMLIYALGLGVVQIYTGMGIQVYRNVRDGKFMDALFDQGLWYLLITGLLMLALPSFAQAGRFIAILGAAGLVLTQGRTQPTLIKKLMSGILSLYNITGYLSDVLSYSRLLALGLATGVIALAINTMAQLVGGTVVGYIIMVALLIGGHAFNLIINTLGAYIHSSRLQYIEFYNRFYEGGGRAFMPFCLQTRHMEIAPEGGEGSRKE